MVGSLLVAQGHRSGPGREVAVDSGGVPMGCAYWVPLAHVDDVWYKSANL